MSNIIGRAQPRLLAYGENDRDFKTLRPLRRIAPRCRAGWNILTLTLRARVPCAFRFRPGDPTETHGSDLPLNLRIDLMPFWIGRSYARTIER